MASELDDCAAVVIGVDDASSVVVCFRLCVESVLMSVLEVDWLSVVVGICVFNVVVSANEEETAATVVVEIVDVSGPADETAVVTSVVA